MQNPLVSIIIPTYNDRPEHIRQAVDSALAQTYPRVEVIVVNDGSSDESTNRFVDSLPGSVRILRQENKGLAGARNAGVAAGSGELIYPLDADDWIDPTLIAEAVEVMTDPVVQIAQPIREIFGDRSLTYFPPAECTLARLMDSNPLTACGMLRRAKWDELGGWSETLREGAEDYEFWTSVLRDGGVSRRIPRACFHRRSREGSLSHMLPPKKLVTTQLTSTNGLSA